MLSYSGKENEGVEETVDRNITALINLIRSKYLSTDSENKPMDFGRKAQYFTLDIISDLSYREPFGFLATDSNLYDYIDTTEKVFTAALMVTIFPWLNWLLRPPLLKAALPSEKDPLGLGKIIRLTHRIRIQNIYLLETSITKKVVAERFGPNKRVQRDMLGSFIAHGLNREEAESEVIIQMCSNPHCFPLGYRLAIRSMAGGDTSATAIRATLLHLIMHPHVTSKLRNEFTSHPISSPIQDAEARKLPYLQAVIKEGLRIFPPVVGLMSKEVPREGDAIDNRFVPGGTRIGYGAYGIFRDKKVWGQDADTFRPERWFDATPDMESSLELIFSYGRFQCLGKNLAMMELNKIFVEVRTVHVEAYSLRMN